MGNETDDEYDSFGREVFEIIFGLLLPKHVEMVLSHPMAASLYIVYLLGAAGLSLCEGIDGIGFSF